MKKILIFVVALAILIFWGVLLVQKKDVPQEKFRYDYRLDYNDERYSDQVAILVFKYDIKTNRGSYYTGIIDTSLYRYIHQHYGLSEESGETKFIQFSMTKEYIEGLSADNKFISGKLIDPTTKQQIGHWIYDLDKDDFKEVIINQSSLIK